MNKIKLFSAILAFTMLSACSTDPLIGKWSLSDVNYDAILKTMPAEQSGPMKERINAGKKDIIGKLNFEFIKGGKMVAIQPNPSDPKKSETKKGTWKMNKDKKSFVLTFADQPQSSTLIIVKNTSKELVLEEKAPEGQPAGPSPQLIFEKK